MKRTKNLLIVGYIIIMLLMLCGCSLSGEQKSEQGSNGGIKESEFVGEWICLSKNSCNNKKIILTITQDGERLNIVRDMESQSFSGSKITFSVELPNGNTFYSSHTKGSYTLDNGVLTEAFDNDRANYYSVTGELANNICKFAFCYDECGDASYCALHDTENKRYNSLTDSDKKTIRYYINGRYDFYDNKEGGYAGDTYSNTIMSEAAQKYGITQQQAYIIWSTD